MRTSLYGLPLVILSSGCSLFKNTSTAIENSHQLSSTEKELKVIQQKDWLSKSEGVAFYQDTGSRNYAIQIWPKGNFTFSPGAGFSGEAEKILVEGNIKKATLAAGMYNIEQQDKGKAESRVSEKKKQISDEHLKSKRSLPSWKWMLTGVAMLAVLCWFTYRKITEKFNY
ncbi:hypothetical protein [Pedobacter hartonius]|uniref:Uncharacterized protein n=1 Tax=Pedobacter hartonius TaxID=425514 RepID=A0A1H4BUM0_9SPHI|nr:hypothetical protein [Pedobacter hartonius]SEA51790.1 hypothetical protein SAMN05443550_103473 [Pedobacter hartonius]